MQERFCPVVDHHHEELLRSIKSLYMQVQNMHDTKTVSCMFCTNTSIVQQFPCKHFDNARIDYNSLHFEHTHKVWHSLFTTQCRPSHELTRQTATANSHTWQIQCWVVRQQALLCEQYAQRSARAGSLASCLRCGPTI